MKKTITYLLLPNGEKLVSWSRHDSKSRSLNGNRYFIDGGQEGYYRISGAVDAKIVTEPLNAALPWVRNEFTWASRLDKEGNYLEKPVKRKLRELDTSHIEAIVGTQVLSEFITNLFNLELEYRIENNLDICI